MNRQEYDILQNIYLNQFENQRILAKQSGHSLGIVNRSLKSLTIQGYIDEQIQPTNKTIKKKNNKNKKIPNY